MNPILFNALQGQQQGISPGGGQNVPSLQAMQSPQQQQQAYNPFDAGISKAISSARESLGMTEKQQDKALRRSMLSFAEANAQQPRESGFWNNAAQIGRALSPAILAHDEAEEAGIRENNALANQMLAYKNLDEQRRAQAEQQAWQRQHAENQLGETKRYHSLMDNLRRDKAGISTQNGISNLPNNIEGLDIAPENLVPITSKGERLLFVKDKKNSGDILNELNSIKNKYEELQTLSKDDLINPMNPYLGEVANKAKGFVGYHTGNEGLREETKKIQGLKSKLDKFAIEIERKLKGGVLSEGMVKRFENKKILPNFGDAPDVFEEKLNNLIEEMGLLNKAADMSLKYNAQISPGDLMRKEQPTIEEPNRETVRMRDATGAMFAIPINEVEEAQQEGYTVVNE